MKTRFLIISVLVLSIFYSCDNATKKVNEESKQESVAVTSTTDTISLATFESWRGAWESNGQAFTETTLIKYFTMPLVDLTEVIGEAPSESRFYLGLDTTKTPNEPHLLLVGVDANGNDMLDYAAGQYVYDVTAPCPPKCGK